MDRWLVGSLVFAAAMAGRGDAAEPEPQWQPDLARARAVARAAGKPIFLVFRCER